MSTYMEIEEIKSRYNNGKYSCKIKFPYNVPRDHIFDEELSVRRNREMVEEYNRKAEDARKEYHAKVCELNRKLTDDVITYIVSAYNITKNQAHIIEEYAYDHRNSMNEYFDSIDEIADMVEKVLNVKEVRN